MSDPAAQPPAAPCPISVEVVDGYTVHRKEDGSDYLDLYQRLRRGEIRRRVLLHDDPGHFVHLVRVDGRAYVYKRVKGQDANIETTLWQLFVGPFYSGLMRRVNRAVASGCRVVPDMYLVAEKMRGRWCSDKYLLMEYIEGECMEKFKNMNRHRAALATAFADLHDHGLSLGNVKKGNLVLTDAGIKFIDLSTRCTQLTGRAKDALRLKSKFGVQLPPRSLADRLARLYVGFLFGFSRCRNVILESIGLRNKGL